MCRKSALIFLIAFGSTAGQSQPKIQAVVNSASFQTGMPSGGALATIFISGVAGTPGVYVAPASEPLPSTLQGFEVVVNGAKAPILAVIIPADPAANTQINIQVPLERDASFGAQVGGTLSVAGAELSPLPPDLGGFFADASGYAVALHASDRSRVTLQNPAHAGEQIIAYANGFFPVWPPPPIAIPVPQQPNFSIPSDLARNQATSNFTYLYLQKYPPNVTCAPVPACGQQYTYTNTPALQINAERLAPNTIGVEEVWFTVPSNQAAGDWAFFFNRGSCPDGSGQSSCAGPGRVSFSSPYATLPVR
jgi:uncharacterized protein (TIGR03437 family)